MVGSLIKALGASAVFPVVVVGTTAAGPAAALGAGPVDWLALKTCCCCGGRGPVAGSLGDEKDREEALRYLCSWILAGMPMSAIHKQTKYINLMRDFGRACGARWCRKPATGGQKWVTGKIGLVITHAI